ncbi:MAG: EAL domain-containing protein, partial [Rhodopila sp.]
DRIITSLEYVQDRLLDHMQHFPGTTDTEQFHNLMRDMASGMSQTDALLLTDRHGNVVNRSQVWPPPAVNLADRGYFQFARAHPETPTFVSEVVIGRQTGRPIFNIVRRLSAPDGTFNGLLIGSIEVDYVQQLLGGSAQSEGGSIALFRSNGTMLARSPPVPLDTMLGREAAFRVSLSGVTRGVVRRNRVIDGVDCLSAISPLPRHPVFLVMSAPLGAILADWKANAVWLAIIAALGCLATASTAVLAIRRFGDAQRLAAASAMLKIETERAGAEQEIARQHARYRMALDNMSQGLMMFDLSSRLLLANAAIYTLFGFPPGALEPGMTPADIAQALAKAGQILERNVKAAADFYARLVEQNVPAQFVRKWENERILAGVFTPIDGGWILTYEDITEMRKADEQIVHMAHHDALTGLPNRVAFRRRAEGEIAALRSDGVFAVMCLDLDHFKDINDTLGHPAGDRLLCETAHRIRSVTRRTDLVARLGGDEFALVVSPVPGRAIVADIATRLIDTISAPYDIDGQMVFVGVSIGIAMAPMDGADPDTLMKSADLALYQAKGEGRGRFAFFEPIMQQHVIERQRIERELHERELHDAMARNEFQLYYQPLVQVPSRRIVGFEALLRWLHPVRGMVSPAEFIPVAEENGFIVRIGELALRQACLEAAGWPGALKVAVNLSPVQFRSGKLVQTVAAALEVSGLAADRLELEITENLMMANTEATLATLTQLKALGVRIAMDDFGTGYSSLAYLQKFPFDKVKIDRAFVRDIEQPTNLAIIRAVRDITESMGVGTTAEGVETEAQFAAVHRARCDEAQGFLFSPPRPAGEIPAMLAGEVLSTAIPDDAADRQAAAREASGNRDAAAAGRAVGPSDQPTTRRPHRARLRVVDTAE